MLTIVDFEKPFYNLKQQGNDTDPKSVTLIVIAWEPKGKGEPPLSATQLQDLFFGTTNSVAHWFEENSQGRYRLEPHSSIPVIGPLQSVYPWPFYWRNDPGYVRNLLCGDPELYCEAWQNNPYKVPPPEGDSRRHIHNGKVYYLDDEGYIGGHTHSWAEAVRTASDQINFGDLDLGSDNYLSVDEGLVVTVKAQASRFGTQRSLTGSDVPKTDFRVDNVKIDKICEVYIAPPHGAEDLAVAIEEVLHLAANLADQYPDPSGGDYRRHDDPGRPGQLALTDAGHKPVHIDPYHKLKWGWLNPQLADHSGRYTLHDVATTGDALILYNPGFGTDEFFILENRWRGNSYDRYRNNDMQEGLALWHCIQDTNLSHDWARRAVHLRRADPRLDNRENIQYSLTLFDGSDPTRSYDLHDDSEPQNLRFSNGRPSYIKIKNISRAGSTMTVDVELPSRIALVSAHSGKYIRAGIGTNSQLAAASEQQRDWETFRLIELDGNIIALQSDHSGKYVRSGIGSDSKLAAVSDRVEGWETFYKIELPDGAIALKSVQNGKYVRAGVGSESYLAATSMDIREWETFELVVLEQ